jgi:hypothetical protein
LKVFATVNVDVDEKTAIFWANKKTFYQLCLDGVISIDHWPEFGLYV